MMKRRNEGSIQIESQPLLERGKSHEFAGRAPRQLRWIERFGPFYQTQMKVQIWHGIILFFALHNAVSIPVRFAYKDLWQTDLWYILLIDYVGDLCFILDILKNFRLSYMEHGFLHTDTNLIFRHYIRGEFILDCIASLPLDFFSFVVWKHALLRLPRLLRLRRAFEYVSFWEQRTKHLHAASIMKLSAAILLLIHWMGCSYMAVVYHFGFSTSDEGYGPPVDFENSSFWSQLLWGLFWAVKMTTSLGGALAPPENDWERLFTWLSALVSVVLASYIIGTLVNFMGELDGAMELFRQRRDNLNMFMTNKAVPPMLQQKISNYNNHLWSRQGGVEDISVLSELPVRLHTEVSLILNGDIISKVPFFQNCNQGFINALVTTLRPEIFLPGDWIIKAGDIGMEMYFISAGHVEVVLNDGTVASKLGEGAFFGEIALLFAVKRTASIRSVGYVDVSVLRKTSLDKLLKLFPEERTRICQMAEERISRDSLRNLIYTDFLFENVDRAFPTALIPLFQAKLINPGEFIYRIGDKSEMMYFLGYGALEFLGPPTDAEPEGVLLKQLNLSSAQLNEGFFFGDVEFLQKTTRTESCKFVRGHVILVISRTDFELALSNFPPNVKETIEKVVLVEEKSQEDIPALSRMATEERLEYAKRKEAFQALLEDAKTSASLEARTAAAKILLSCIHQASLSGSSLVPLELPDEESTEYPGLTQGQVKTAEEQFAEFDVDKNGTLDKNEFTHLMVKLTPGVPLLQARRFADLQFRAADVDKSGAIDKREFLLAYAGIVVRRRNLEEKLQDTQEDEGEED